MVPVTVASNNYITYRGTCTVSSLLEKIYKRKLIFRTLWLKPEHIASKHRRLLVGNIEKNKDSTAGIISFTCGIKYTAGIHDFFEASLHISN